MTHVDAGTTSVVVRDVGPRDGLQAEAPIAVGDRIELVRRLAACGLTEIEICAFVSPKAVPSMAGAGEVAAAVGELAGVRTWALVPNVRGAELALAAGMRNLTVTVSASPRYSEKNVGMTLDQSLEQAATICALDDEATIDVVVSCAFGSPFADEHIAPAAVAEASAAIHELGAAVTLADTTGVATPSRIDAVLEATGTDVGLHLHDNRAMALLCAHHAIGRGVNRFDTSVGGIGGSPFAPGASGNLATESLVALLDDAGIRSGASLAGLIDTGRWLGTVLGHELPSALLRAGN